MYVTDFHIRTYFLVIFFVIFVILGGIEHQNYCVNRRITEKE